MVPSGFVLLEQLPLTPNGKIDRQKLRQLHAALGTWTSEQRPRTQTEALLADIWAQALQQEPDSIGHRDDFFDLGGDSLTAAVVVAKVHGIVGVELKLGMFFDHPVLADLAALIDELARTGPARDPQRLVRVPREDPLPLSFFQERIWSYSQTPKAAAPYTVARSYRLRGPLDAEALRECMTYIARRHEILRTTFAVVEGQPVQVIHPAAPVPLPLLDLGGSTDAERRAADFFKQEASRIFDLARAPLVVFSLVRIRENEHLLLRVSHHIISDGWSWDVYWRELALLYEAKLRRAEPPLPEFEPLQYADYAAWQRKILTPGDHSYQATLAWWKDRFSRARGALPDFVPRRRQLLRLRFARARPLREADAANPVDPRLAEFAAIARFGA
jgi:acyl carrier protein